MEKRKLLSPTFPKGILGIHVSKKSKVLEDSSSRSTLNAIITDLSELNLNAAQIFSHGPRGHTPVDMNRAEIKEYIDANNVTLIVHSSYPTITVWRPENRGSNLKKQLDACIELGAFGLVVHLPNMPAHQIARKMRLFTRFTHKATESTRLLLEISPVKPDRANHSYASPKDLKELCHAIDSEGVPKSSWGLCIDTAHLWASGVDVSSSEAMRQWLDDMNHYLNRIKLVHLNGCVTDFGLGKDEHAIIWNEEDKMYGRYAHDKKMSGAYVLYKYCLKNHVSVILEINRGSEEEVVRCLETLKNIV